jgi:hypothetical protein
MQQTEKTEFEKRIKDLKASQQQSFTMAQTSHQSKEKQMQREFDAKIKTLTAKQTQELHQIESKSAQEKSQLVQ